MKAPSEMTGKQLTGLIIGVVLLVFAIAYYSESKECSAWSRIAGLESKYDFSSGCWVKFEQGWLKL
ncbi:hypothetical protein Acj9p103 [Acinetobacter phage Acj9]|uniref:Uncharacterized protein n=1 Tax=Acinetobacter phage Acj9 TaxID=760939 RepID=E5EPN7_9CAUD|nr:hypothetical protein Acj9p103 [Acinetobacter phage Acj9]ADG60003.1 hypothetical protein Acj9p103 [Acinetobacter phage Acj9]